jgi:hypothetical protein
MILPVAENEEKQDIIVIFLLHEMRKSMKKKWMWHHVVVL